MYQVTRFGKHLEDFSSHCIKSGTDCLKGVLRRRQFMMAGVTWGLPSSHLFRNGRNAKSGGAQRSSWVRLLLGHNLGGRNDRFIFGGRSLGFPSSLGCSSGATRKRKGVGFQRVSPFRRYGSIVGGWCLACSRGRFRPLRRWRTRNAYKRRWWDLTPIMTIWDWETSLPFSFFMMICWAKGWEKERINKG